MVVLDVLRYSHYFRNVRINFFYLHEENLVSAILEIPGRKQDEGVHRDFPLRDHVVDVITTPTLMKEFFLCWSLGMVKLVTNFIVFMGALLLMLLFIPIAVTLGLHDIGVSILEGRRLRAKRRKENEEIHCPFLQRNEDREIRDPYENWGDRMK